MATVMASEELAHGQITSGRSPRAWNTLRKASQDDIDPVLARAHAHTHTQRTDYNTNKANQDHLLQLQAVSMGALH